MTVDDCIAQLKTSEAVPKAALAAGVGHADALAPVVYGLAEKFCRGVYLLPTDAELLFNGLHVLAAARHPGLLDHVLALARQPSEELNRLFPDRAAQCLTRLILSVWDRESAELFRLIEVADMEADSKWALYDALARLTFDGRIPRAETTAFLARIARDSLIGDDDMAWWGWEHAVERLGLVELESDLRRVWQKPIYSDHGERDLEELLVDLRAAAANPTDPAPFDKDDIRPIDDPVEAMAWIEQRAEAMARWHAEQEQKEGPPPPDTDAAKDQRLSEAEQMWLEGLLVSRQVPETTMPLEALDGFMTALVIGPVMVPPSEWLAEVWGTEDMAGVKWDSLEQANHLHGLLMKRWNAIAARRMADAPHVPIIASFGVANPGEEWCQGFLDGLEMGGDAWKPFFEDRKTERLFVPIELLAGEVESAEGRITRERRTELIARLPETLRRIAAYWRDPASAFPKETPRRSAKVGRNEPCPCGSGKKFKKCCGAAGAVH